MMDVIIDPQADDYRVDLNVFQGPLDLLLYLIRKEEVDVYDIPIARITKQYIKYIEMMTVLNLEVAGEFVLMAATLIRIKARLLLPRDESDQDEPDLREELIMALVEYKKFKEAGDILRERAHIEDRNFVPTSPVGKIEGIVDEIPDVNLFDLISALKDVMEAKREEVFHQVSLVEVNVEDRMAFVMSWLNHSEQASFGELFADLPRKIVAVVTFFALLELSRSRRIMISQVAPFSELRVYRGERFAEPRGAADLIDFALPDQPDLIEEETVS